MGQMIQIVKPNAFGFGLIQPLKLVIIGRAIAVLISKVQQRAADALDRRPIQGFVITGIGLGSLRDSMVECVLRIDHPPPHQGGARPMHFYKPCGETARFVVHNIGYIALLSQLNLL